MFLEHSTGPAENKSRLHLDRLGREDKIQKYVVYWWMRNFGEG